MYNEKVKNLEREIYFKVNGIQEGADTLTIEICENKIKIKNIWISCEENEDGYPYEASDVCLGIYAHIEDEYPMEKYTYEFTGKYSNTGKNFVCKSDEYEDIQEIF